MTGLEAIAANNGWRMAAAGICIVFTALVTLSLIISQLYKILIILEKRDEYIKKLKRLFTINKRAVRPPKIKNTDNFTESARQFNLLIKSMGEPFSLPKLIELAGKIGIGNPHSSVNDLIVAKLIIPDNKGFYCWDHMAYQNIVKKES